MPIAEKKIVIVGDGESGKTCLVRKYFEFQYSDVYVPTVFDSFTTIVQTNGKMVKLELWDTAGQDDYDRLRPLSYTNTDVVIVCYSVERPESLVNVTAKWMPEVWLYCKDVPVILVGNKKDLRDDPVVPVPRNSIATVGADGRATFTPVADGRATLTPVADGRATLTPVNEGRAPLTPVTDGLANRCSRDSDRPEFEECGKGSDRKSDAERIHENYPVTNPWESFAADENSTPEELDW